MASDIEKKYFELFNELPYLLTTQSYDNDDYQVLMIMAINRGNPLTKDEIEEYFYNNYDIVNIERNKINKNPVDLAQNIEGEDYE